MGKVSRWMFKEASENRADTFPITPQLLTVFTSASALASSGYVPVKVIIKVPPRFVTS